MIEDVNGTIAFYRDVLGFELVMSVPAEGPLDWALMKRGDAEVMFQARAGLREALPLFADRAVGGALTFYIDTDDVAGLYERVRARVNIVKEMRHTFYGTREFSIEDCNGFTLTFAEHVGGEAEAA